MKNILITSSLLFLFSCSSPLSDVEIADPKLITPHFTVIIEDTESGTSNSINACLNDKNLGYIKLLKGEVQLNNEAMGFKGNCYRSSANIDAETKYSFVVTLADSSTYESTVSTPNYIEKVNFPNSVRQKETYIVSWKDNYNGGFTNVSFEVLDSNNIWQSIFEKNTKTKSSVKIKNLVFPKNSKGKGKIKITRTEKGALNQDFNGGSISADFIYEREVEIIE